MAAEYDEYGSRSSSISSENQEYGAERRDFYPTRILGRAANAQLNPGPTTPPQIQSQGFLRKAGGWWRDAEEHEESELNMYRLLIRSLGQQIEDLRDRNAFLSKILVHENLSEEPKPEVARWEFLKPHMGAIAKELMLGLDPRKNRLFPREKHIKEAILEAFDTSPTDSVTRKVFNRMWVETLRTKAKTCISNTRGRFSTIARTQLWRYLGVPKPQRGTQEEIEAWKRTLEPLAEDNQWRWSEEDPFGSDAFCNTISHVKFGQRYSEEQPLRLTAKQLAWFAYVMHLAMNGDRNMKESDMRLHKKEMKGLKKFILDSRHLLKKIDVVVVQDGDGVQEFFGEELEDDY